MQRDFFAPVASLVPVQSDEEALELDRRCPYALGSSVFGADLEAACALAEKIDAEFVTVNDLIAPTADPRLPFGGRGESGYGTTRGAEGLLEMTVPKAVVTRRAHPAPPHFEPLTPAHENLFKNYITLMHDGRPGRRLRALGGLFGALKQIVSERKSEESNSR